MADVVLFHHVQGLTDGVRSLANQLGRGGHTVHTPDLFEGRLFDTVDDGFAHMRSIGDGTVKSRADESLAELPAALVYAGVSWGVSLAQGYAQTRPGAQGALLYEACLPVSGEWAIGPWPPGVPVQIHGMDADPFFADEGDIDSARELASAAGPGAELFVYPGDRHLFTDSSLPSHDADARGLVVHRSLAFLGRLGRTDGTLP